MELPAGFLRIPLLVPVLQRDFQVVDPEGANDPEQKIWYYHQAEGLKTIVHIWIVGVFFKIERHKWRCVFHHELQSENFKV